MASITHNLVSLIARFRQGRVISYGASTLTNVVKVGDLLEQSLALFVAHMATIGDTPILPWDRSANKVLKTM
ncbi:MAG: hypothetical protein AAF267_11580 [Deinococcota bacterium]